MKKKLNTSRVMSELTGVSPFFPTATEEPKQEDAPSPIHIPRADSTKPEKKKPAPATDRYHDTMKPRHRDTTVSRNHATTGAIVQDNDLLEKARKAVKQIGKEAATHRFTLEEKNMLADIEYTYRRQGIRTSENEITRIAMNYFAEDYRKNGEESLLAKVLKLLNS